MKLLLITDSLGLPRNTPELVKYNETWCGILSNEFDIHQCSIGGGTISKLLSQLEYLKMYEPDRIIIQSGIVDCAPRALSEVENYLLNKYKLTSKLLRWGSGRLIPLLRKRGKTYTSIDKFQRAVKRFKSEFGEKLYWIGIVPPSKDYEKKIPGISKNILAYNQLLKKELGHNLIDITRLKSDCIMPDFIHLNTRGNRCLAEQIIARIK